MKNNKQNTHLTTTRVVTAVVVAVIAALVSLIRYPSVIPTGTVIVNVVLPVVLASCFVLDWQSGALTFVITAIVTMLMRTVHWQDLIAWAVAMLVAVMVERAKFKDQLVLSHRSLILLGLSAGLSQLLVELILYAGVGLSFDGVGGMRAFISLVVPVALANALLTSLLTAPLTMLLRWTIKKISYK